MTFMPWTDDLSVGLPEVDTQHLWLVQTTNRLHHELNRDSINRSDIGQTIDGLMEYTMNHFVVEEELFQRFEYPETLAHKALHDKFTKNVMDILTHFEAGGEIGMEVLDLLKDWLVNHIMKVDKAYVPFLSARTDELT